MTKPPKLKLRTQVDAMTPAPWRPGSVETFHVFCADGATLGPDRVLLRMNVHFTHAADATGIAALRNAAPVLVELWEACVRARDAVCENQSLETDDYTRAADRDECAGENHVETCPVELANQDIAAVLNKGLP